MNIYIDESYNFQKSRGKQFISINGFTVLDDKALRKDWKQIRRPYLKHHRRIHAADLSFKKLQLKSVKFLNNHDICIISVFQLIQEIPPGNKYFDNKLNKVNYEKVYLELLKILLVRLSIREYKNVRIVIDKRSHKGGLLGSNKFQNDIDIFLQKEFPEVNSIFTRTPSYSDILLELADFISNTFYKEYQKSSEHVFHELGFKLIQIKNPL